ncbi:MAG: hypothetical protein ACREV5_22415 [Steroidobacter sp.]
MSTTDHSQRELIIEAGSSPRQYAREVWRYRELTLILSWRNIKAFTVVDPALPPSERNRPRRTLMVIRGLVLGAVFGAFLVLARSLWSRASKRGGPGTQSA